MNILKTFNDEKVSDEVLVKFKLRDAVRAVMFNNDNKIALLHSHAKNYYSLPGGGVEREESFEQAVIRECKEEIGFDVKILKELGFVDEIRKEKMVVNHSKGFIVKTIGQQINLNLIEDEKAEETEILWVSPEEAIELLNRDLSKLGLYFRYTQMRDIIFIQNSI